MDAPKVYHLNVIFRYAVSEQVQNQWQPARFEFERIRIILNKQGIVRIETTLPRGEMKYTESEL
jgi:hypothetical protein